MVYDVTITNEISLMKKMSFTTSAASRFINLFVTVCCILVPTTRNG